MPRVVLFALLCSASALAQVAVLLENDQVLRGFVLDQSDEFVSLKIPRGSIKLDRARIRRINALEDAAEIIKLIEQFPPAEQPALLDRSLASRPSEALRTAAVRFCIDRSRKELSDSHLRAAHEYALHALRLDPGSSEAATARDAAALRLDRARKVLQSLRLILQRCPDDAGARYQLALCCEQLGEVGEAVTLLKGLASADPSLDVEKLSLDQLKEWGAAHLVKEDADAGHDLLPEPVTGESKHFRISAYDRRAADELLRAAEESLTYLAARFSLELKASPITIQILRSREDYSAQSPLPNTYATMPDPRTILTYHGASSSLPSLITHELIHLLIYQNLGKPAPWLDEGLACYLEPSSGIYYTKASDFLAGGGLFELPRLFAVRSLRELVDRDALNRFYVTSFVVVDQMVEKGGIRKVFELVKGKRYSPEDIQAIFGLGTADIEKAMLSYGKPR